MAWYGSSFTYYEPDPGELDAAAVEARARRLESFSPDQFTPRPDGGGDSTGIVLGRFLPVHDGHRYLVEVARAFARRLWIFVRINRNDRIPWEVRRDWLTGLFPDVTVVPVADPARFTREDLFALWDERVREHVLPDYVVMGNDYGPELARRFGARLLVVDRTAVPVSGSRIRSWPARNAAYLPPPVRTWYLANEPAMEPFEGPGPVDPATVGRVCLIGPESTGKTHLALRLAIHYGTVHVPEFARGMRHDWDPPSISLIAHGQRASETAMARRANRVLFCDTDLLAVRLWSERLFGAAPDWLQAATGPGGDIDLYLLTSSDQLFVGPPEYNRPAERHAFFHRCRAELTRQGHRYVILAGAVEGRLRTAVQAVDALLAEEA
ncbi:nicotinamide-nucleotide adenylyltransferase [Virgisporangium ochraceum]|uniref:Transcriptional regulator NadR n=2 Tax=Virgisporangium ochraceum TaxID=65505 RepID=A0A8J3ZQ31_9ACTN|nr:transcriptional regulator NadR [Virgisporangium ochraceum]